MSIHDIINITFLYSILTKTEPFSYLQKIKKPPLQKKVAQVFLKKAKN